MNQRVEPPDLDESMPITKRRHPVASSFRVLLQIVIPLLILAGGYQAFTTLRDARASVPQRPATERAKPIEAMKVTAGTVTPTLALYGQIVAGRTVDLRMLVGGVVKEVSSNLAEGGEVKAGEMLVIVDDFEAKNALARAEADLMESTARLAELKARAEAENAGAVRAREQVDLAIREVDRLTTLQKGGNSTQTALEAAQNRLSQARASFETRESQTAILDAQKAQVAAQQQRQQVAVAEAQRASDDTRLVAPFAGIVSNAAADVGRLLNTNDRVATLVDPSRYEVRFTLSDGQYARLAFGSTGLIGREVRIGWQGETGRVEKLARIIRVAPQVSATAGGYEVFAALEETDRMVRPGAFVAVSMADAPYEQAVALPQSAIQNEAVFAVIDNRLKRVPVTLLGFDGTRAILRGDFPDGAPILTTRLTDASDGLLVRVQP